MGEYAKHNGSEIKIGTCESMYYLRADQAHLVEPMHGNVDPIRDADGIRFRFPFPDEDTIEPGHFDDHNRGVRIPGWNLPAEFEGHGGVQFHAEPGYLLYLPCPEGGDFPDGIKVGRNGWHGGAVVRQQRYLAGALVTVVACSSCDAAWRLETLDDAAPVIEAFRAEAEREEIRHDRPGGRIPANGETQRAFLHAMADRIAAGYALVREEVTA